MQHEKHEVNDLDALKQERHVSRRTALKVGAGAAVLAAGAGTWLGWRGMTSHADTAPTYSSPTIVVQWNNVALQAISATATGPTIGARALAIVHTCMYDAWTTYDPIALPTRPNGILKQKDKKLVATPIAVSYAAYRALVDLFPSQIARFNSLMSTLGYDPNNTSTDTTTPIGVGNVAAQAVLTFRHSDGSNQLGDLHPGAYSDYTGYVPVNDPYTINDPNRWQPLLGPNGQPQKFLTPQWGQVTPFALTSGSQFRPAGPAVVSQPAYKAQADTVLQLSAGLNDTNKVIAEYWADGPHSVTPPGHWDLFAQFFLAQNVSKRKGNSLAADIQLFFALTNAIFDASIAVWDCKRYYDSVRPITAVRYLYSGQQITAWGGPGKGTQTFDGSLWKSYIATPAFAEYVSGHSTFSAAGAIILSGAQLIGAWGSDNFSASYTAQPGSSTIEPGITPATAITLSWSSFSDAASQAGMSRCYGGIHFQQANEDGHKLGQQVALQAGLKALAYINGSILS